MNIKRIILSLLILLAVITLYWAAGFSKILLIIGLTLWVGVCVGCAVGFIITIGFAFCELIKIWVEWITKDE